MASIRFPLCIYGKGAVIIGSVVLLFRLVSGAGDIKLTKDGNVLLHEMVISGF